MSNKSTVKDQLFWKTKSLKEMSQDEWKSLCDGCGRCCLYKINGNKPGEVYHTCIACRLFDDDKCRCTSYENRAELASNCIVLTPDNIKKVHWLPDSCAYRRLDQGKELEWWHPLVSGFPKTVIEAGISVRHETISELAIAEEDHAQFVIKFV